MLPKQPYPVDIIATHYDPHEDELNQREQARSFGKQMFPGICQAKTILMNAGLHLETGKDGDYYLTTQKTLCDGVCGGEFDEHDKKDGERCMQSAALRMASWLDRQNDPGLKPLLDFSLRADRHAGNSVFELPNLIKSWWNAGFRLNTVLPMYHTIFQSLYWKFSGGKLVAQPAPGEFRRLIAEWFAEKFGDHDGKELCQAHKLDTGQKAAELFDQINDETWPIVSLDTRDGAVGGKTDFDLEGIWEAMVQASVPAEERNRIMFGSLHAKYVEQLDFQAACREFSNNVAYLVPNRSVYRIGIITSDSRQMNRAARFCDMDIDVLIQFCNDGHARIFDLRKRLNMNPVAAQLRMAEWHKHGKTFQLSMRALLSEGTLRYIRQWFNWQEGHGVFCGTNTAPNMPCTWLTKDEIVSCVAKGLYYTYRDTHAMPWRQFRQWLERKKEQKKEEAAVRNLAKAIDEGSKMPDAPPRLAVHA